MKDAMDRIPRAEVAEPVLCLKFAWPDGYEDGPTILHPHHIHHRPQEELLRTGHDRRMTGPVHATTPLTTAFVALVGDAQEHPTPVHSLQPRPIFLPEIRGVQPPCPLDTRLPAKREQMRAGAQEQEEGVHSTGVERAESSNEDQGKLPNSSYQCQLEPIGVIREKKAKRAGVAPAILVHSKPAASAGIEIPVLPDQVSFSSGVR